MKSRNLIILALVVVVLGAYVLFHERHQMTTEEKAERSERVFPDLDRDQVTAIDVQNSHGEFRFERRGDDWRLVAPIDFPADSSTVGSMLSSVVNLREERRLEPGEVEPAAYGLDAPESSVILATADGGVFELRVGNETPLGSNRAIQIGGFDGIVLSPGWFTNDIDKELDDWRSRDLVNVVASDVAAVQVMTAHDRIHAVRDGDIWQLLEPLEDAADPDHMRNLISDLNGLRIEEFLDDAPVPAELGLEAPEYRVTIVRSEGADPVRLDFGAAREEDDATTIACRRGTDEYFWVTDGAATRLAKAPVRWRSVKVHDFDTWDAESLTISTPSTTVTLTREDSLWRLPDGGELDYTGIQDRLRVLADLEAIEFDLLAPVTEQMGSVELELKAGTSTSGVEPVRVSYVFHRPLTEDGDAIATVSTRSTVMSVDPEEVAEILEDPESLRKPEPTPEPETETEPEPEQASD